MGIDAQGVEVTGPVKIYTSSSFAERAWCDTCGSALWLRDLDSETYELMPGLFENAGGARLNREVYADHCPTGVAFAGDHDRITAARYEAENRHCTGDAT